MSNDNKTLADVQPGGMVRLGDGLPPLPRHHSATRGSCILLYTEYQMQDYARAALSAQPSPGGQGEALLESLVARWRNHAEEIGVSDNLLCQKIANCTMRHAAELQAALAARQPVGQEPLWCLHVLGMDDVHPAPSKAHAERAAAWHNEQFKDQAARLGISIEAKVVPWPHSAESHAAGVAEFIPQWLIPQWQLDALEANAATPAQAVDLGPLWVSVNDRLPSEEDYGESGDVVVRYRYNTPNSVQGSWDVGESRHDADDIEWNNGWLFGSCDYAEVSHWMPKHALLDLIDSQAVCK